MQNITRKTGKPVKTMNDTISIIIPCKNEEKSIKNILNDLRKQKLHALELEIIVSDASSTDNTVSIVKKYGAKVIKGGIPAVGRNNGAKVARGDIIIFLDADVRIFDESFIEKIVYKFLKKKLDAAAMMQLPYFEDNNTLRLKKGMISLTHRVGNAMFMMVKNRNPRAGGAGMIFKKDVFLKNGGFRKNIYWGEDTELAQRLSKKGYKFDILFSKIYCSARKVLKYGIITTVWNVYKLDHDRIKFGKITKRDYNRITGINDYYKK